MIAHKYNWLYILQGWAILWVVIGNTYLVQAGNGLEWERALLRTAYSFHLPLLMFVSGCIFCKSFLLSDDNPQQKNELLKSHVLRLVVPFVLFTFITIIAKAVLSRSEFSYGFMVGDFIQGFMFPGEHPMSPLWFVMVLIWLYLMYPVWEFIIEKPWLVWAYRKGWIDEEKMRELAKPMLKNQYGQYLLNVIDEIKRTGDPNI